MEALVLFKLIHPVGVKWGVWALERRLLGQKGEALAVAHLKKRGMRIETRNFRCRLGEIDLIAWEGQTLVFVEVRSRTSVDYGLPQESIDYRKQRRLRQIAQFYLYGRSEKTVRFDVVAVQFDQQGNPQHIEHITNAF